MKLPSRRYSSLSQHQAHRIFWIRHIFSNEEFIGNCPTIMLGLKPKTMAIHLWLPSLIPRGFAASRCSSQWRGLQDCGPLTGHYWPNIHDVIGQFLAIMNWWLKAEYAINHRARTLQGNHFDKSTQPEILATKHQRQTILQECLGHPLYSEYSTIMLMEKKKSSIYM